MDCVKGVLCSITNVGVFLLPLSPPMPHPHDRERLHVLQHNQQLMLPQIMEPGDSDLDEREAFTEPTPDLLVATTTQQSGRMSPSSLFDEIMTEEGEAAPCLRSDSTREKERERERERHRQRERDRDRDRESNANIKSSHFKHLFS